MGQNDLLKGLRDITGESQVKVDEPMSIHTTFRIGGTADYFVMPSSISELQSVLHLLKKIGHRILCHRKWKQSACRRWRLQGSYHTAFRYI